MESGRPGGTPPGSRLSRRFDSWKEIGAYFGRDVRTVRRWERSEGLPVHRHLHRSRGSVYAFQSELDDWMALRSAPPRGHSSSRRSLAPTGLVMLVAVVLVSLTAWGAIHTDRASSGPGVRRAERGAPGDDPARLRAADADVRDLFMRARHHLQRRAGFRQQAREYLEAATGRSPEFAEAHALLGEAYLRQALFDPARRAAAWPKAEASARRALALDPNLAAAHWVLSRILLLRDWNWSSALAESLRAIALEPDSPDTRSTYALYLRSTGRVAEAIVERERAQRADPVNPHWLVALGDEYTFARRYDDALRAYHRALELERDYRPAVASLADTYPRAGQEAEGVAWRLRWLALTEQANVAAAFDDVRRREGPGMALTWYDRRSLAEFARAPDEHLWDLAYMHARLGDREAALEFLQRAYRQRNPGLLQARVDPDLDGLRGDPRFEDLLANVSPH